MRLGVLAVQGAFREHRLLLEQLDATVKEVRRKEHLAGLDGLVIPGGESTAIGKLMAEYQLLDTITKMGGEGFPIFGTCAGMVLLAKEIAGSEQVRLGLMNITVQRNAFGRQIQSFETELEVEGISGGPFPAVFIRAPFVAKAGNGVQILARHNGKIVMVRQNNLLACAFHPELTGDTRIHQYFIEMVAQ